MATTTTNMLVNHIEFVAVALIALQRLEVAEEVA